METIIAIGVGAGLVGSGIGWILNTLLRRYSAPETDQPRWVWSKSDHAHEFAHNPGDGYFYCILEGCNARKKLGE